LLSVTKMCHRIMLGGFFVHNAQPHLKPR